MGLALVIPPTAEPVSLAEIKERLAIDHDHADTLLVTLVAAARASIERLTRRPLMTQTWRWTLDGVPATALRLPIAPVQAVPAVSVTNADGVTVPFAGPKLLDLADEPPRLAFPADRPTPGVAVGGVTIDIVAGYGSLPSAVPEPLRQAVALLAAHWYGERGLGPSPGLPPSVTTLTDGWRRLGLVA